MDNISNRIKHALSVRNMKQIDLVEKTKIPKGSISQYVSGYVEPKSDRIYLIAKALDVSPTWLLGYDVPMEEDNNLGKYGIGKSNLLVERINLLDEDRIKLLTAYLELLEKK